MLRALPGLDLPDFLAGSRYAFTTCTRLMYERRWIELRPLVSDACFDAMQQTMEEIASSGRRISERRARASVAPDSY